MVIPATGHTKPNKYGKCDVCGKLFDKIGDGNCDGKIDAQDLILLIDALLTDTEYIKVFDTNEDGDVNILDLVRLKKYLANGTPLGKQENSQE